MQDDKENRQPDVGSLIHVVDCYEPKVSIREVRGRPTTRLVTAEGSFKPKISVGVIWNEIEKLGVPQAVATKIIEEAKATPNPRSTLPGIAERVLQHSANSAQIIQLLLSALPFMPR